MTEEPGHELGVREPPGNGPAGVGEDVQILLRGVEHRQSGTLEERHQQPHVRGERVDQDQLVVPGQLHESELRVVRALTVELGVERVALGRDGTRDDLPECVGVVDPPAGAGRG